MISSAEASEGLAPHTSPWRNQTIRSVTTIVRSRLVRRLLVTGMHAVLVPIAYLLAFALHWEFRIPADQISLLVATLPLLLFLRVVALAWAGLFTGWLRHFGVEDLLRLVAAVSVSQFAFVGIVATTGHLASLPVVIVVLDWMIAVLAFVSVRVAVRLLREGRGWGRSGVAGKPVLVLGAGNAAARFIHSVRTGALTGLSPVGLVDDDPAKRSLHIHGTAVLGSMDDLEQLVRRYDVRLLVIAMPSATRTQMQRVVERCVQTRVEFKVLPSAQELIDGRAQFSRLRNVRIEDLLGRPSVRLGMEDVKKKIAGKRVLITGAAGSIGSELARQICGFAPAEVILVEQAESALYYTQIELTRAFPGLSLVPVIADITDRSRVEQIFEERRPEYVFHAAAYKHVPMMESNPQEAVRNNVFGTLNVAEAAARSGVARFVLISTDKAVNPTSVMGATKRLSEMLVLNWSSLQESKTDFRVVRFGNVLGSDGSVIPLFQRQLEAGGPLTVTHPEVTRYFMTIPEAVHLVLQASTLEEARGRIAMLEMGEPMKIVDLAEKLIQLSGLEPYRDIAIVFSGLRAGEKLHEELVSHWEDTVPTSLPKVHIVQTDRVELSMLRKGVELLSAHLSSGNSGFVLATLRSIVSQPTSDSIAFLGISEVRGASQPPLAPRESPGRAVAAPFYGSGR
jgi:FlaA1/EpsC-like NDP-sugar epimerase